jgi:hypothetical protein
MLSEAGICHLGRFDRKTAGRPGAGSENDSMRLEQVPGRPMSDPVWLYLSAEEARNLLATLERYFEDDGDTDAEWHYHVDAGDGLTIAIEA